MILKKYYPAALDFNALAKQSVETKEAFPVSLVLFNKVEVKCINAKVGCPLMCGT